jgi:hypothetical protein
MPKSRRVFSIFFSLFLLSLASEQSLSAYTDPGSGVMFVQIILAGIIGGVFRVRTFFTRFRRRKNEQTSA